MYWSKFTKNKWRISDSYHDLTSDTLYFNVQNENDRTSVIQIYTSLVVQEFLMFDPILFDIYILLKDYKNIDSGNILKLKGTKNFDKIMETWVYVFEIERTNDIIEMSSTLQNKYFVPLPLKWKPKISNHISILGNKFDLNLNYDLIAQDELVSALMVPEWNLVSVNILSSIICFVLFLCSIRLIPTSSFNDNECFYHLTILNYRFQNGCRLLKYLYDVFMITILFIIYKSSANYYENGYWIDNYSITNMIDFKEYEYIILFLFMIYSFSMYYLINLMKHDNCPIEIYVCEKKNTSITLLYCLFYHIYDFNYIIIFLHIISFYSKK